MQRAATVGSRPNPCQVIIRNTFSAKEHPEPSKSTELEALGRSKSVLSPAGRVPVLAPRRSDRARLEQDMADIWTKDTLPFPGMGSQNLDHQIRASASSVLRKLSGSSLATSLRRRSSGQIVIEADSRLSPEVNNSLELPPPSIDLLPVVVESPVNSPRTSGNSPEMEPKRSMSKMGKIRKRVSGVGLGILPNEVEEDESEMQRADESPVVRRIGSSRALYGLLPQRSKTVRK